MRSPNPASPTWSSNSRARCFVGASPAGRKAVGSMTFSSTVRVGIRLANWKTNPVVRQRSSDRWASVSCQMSWPSMSTRPESGRINPPISERKVDLPAPERPVTTTNSPSSTVPVYSASASITWSPAR